jgi:hypothetical protein
VSQSRAGAGRRAGQLRAYVVLREDADEYAASAATRARGHSWLISRCLAAPGGPLCGAPAPTVAGRGALPPARRGYGIIIVPDGPYTVRRRAA